MVRSALLVDPNADRLDLLRKEIGEAVDVTACTDFQAARDCLLKTSPAFLISHLRLGAYNGLHLAHLAAHARLETRCLLYDEPLDLHLAFEAKLIGAFCETTSRLRFAVPAYIRSPLPERDRRDARRIDRRGLFRGGRRATDITFDQLRGLSSSLWH
jgi:hypothetical protein